MNGYNKNMHSDKIKLRRFAMQLYFAGDAWCSRRLRRRESWFRLCAFSYMQNLIIPALHENLNRIRKKAVSFSNPLKDEFN